MLRLSDNALEATATRSSAKEMEHGLNNVREAFVEPGQAMPLSRVLGVRIV
ncbi:MAG: hypothetical protein QM757_14090 [Paludibaculum sp.]